MARPRGRRNECGSAASVLPPASRRTARCSSSSTNRFPKTSSTGPLATLTIRDIVYPLLWLLALLMLIKSLFNPVDEDAVREDWGKFGLAMIVVAVVAGAIFLPNIVASFHAMSP